ncbi:MULTISPECIES: hypothetical protein [unclassified Streptomyces]|uniref:hypothetical protein n=1 Tax=unclassified Streptomyces TaxID=2593676 RepID=UPI000DB9B9AC|nr:MULTISPECIES: hypothetical protein [unclassified Streptomyces]MYT71868.1 hypothetical protein [Streptomyces sp. SID8367]RAJ75248.1 hypothetical protein K377_06423 [Streptomyces sp. PsTaAH-137]
MIFKSKNELHVLVLRDADHIADAVAAALRVASDAERPGLERAAGLIAQQAAASEAELRGRWVRARLSAAGYEGRADAVEAIKILRRAEPSLSLYAAVQLAKDAVEQD